MIWRESPQQHFPNGPGGNFKGSIRSIHVGEVNCSDFPMDEVLRTEFRNRVTLPLIHAAGMPVLPVWQLTAGNARFHVGSYMHPKLAGIADGKEAFTDCLHHCVGPGAIQEAWLTLLQNQLIHSNALVRRRT
mmetsp:Transcript_967/g.2969  ORF Transcript_967/g.2969 Transcript_967/m.2969 type:complete len:132 (-) Transcript_967:70-465(-)